jgi:uncharacterized surface protein with fasciclin (FAS1) repeats
MMRNSRLSTYAFLAVLTLAACKNEAEAPAETQEAKPNNIEVPRPEKKPLTEEDKEILGSVMMKLMSTPEAKPFVSAMVTVQLTDVLSKEEGPYTVFAPTAAAFDSIPEARRKSLFNQTNKEQLAALLKSHIVKGTVSTADLVQEIKTRGSYGMKTLAGTTLTAMKEGTTLYLKNENGVSATIGKSDIQGNNGTVHLVDAVLLSSN